MNQDPTGGVPGDRNPQLLEVVDVAAVPRGYQHAEPPVVIWAVQLLATDPPGLSCCLEDLLVLIVPLMALRVGAVNPL